MGKKHRRMEVLRSVVEPRAELVKRSVCSCGFLLEALKTVGLVLFYYTFSISLTFYNQRFIHAFKFPLSITMTHLVTKFLMAVVVRGVWTRCSGRERVTLGWGDYVKRIAPPGIASSLDIGLSNWSFEYITISLYTMTKSTVIIFIMIFSLIFKLEKPRWSLISVVVCIALGLFMFTFESTQFHLVGFLLVFSASFISGLRWTLAQLVLQKSELGIQHPLDMMYHIQPWMMAALLPLSAPFEGLHLATSEDTFGFHDGVYVLRNLAILLAGALLAFMLELSEFLLVSMTSSLTLSISGIVKEIFTLLLAILINGDQMTWLNGAGLVVCLIGILIHVLLRAVYGEEAKHEVKYRRVAGCDEDVMELVTQNGTITLHGGESDSEEEEEVFNVETDRPSNSVANNITSPSRSDV